MSFDQSIVRAGLERIQNLQGMEQLSQLIHELRSLLTATNLAYAARKVPKPYRLSEDAPLGKTL